MISERLPGSAALVLVDGAPLLRPESQVFDAMLEGWAAQKASRNLGVEGRVVPIGAPLHPRRRQIAHRHTRRCR